MSQPNPEWEDPNKLMMQATRKLFERITPWLLEVGSWIFGGLIAFSLIIMSALITIGPVDSAIIVAITVFAFALPLDVAGLFLLRLVRDLEHVGVESEFESYENEVRRALQSAGASAGEQLPAPKPFEAARQRRTAFALIYSFGILALSGVLTLAGMSGALWHMAWWIAVAFAVSVLISLATVTIAVLTAQPPDSPEEKARMRGYGREIARRARAQSQQDKELAQADTHEHIRGAVSRRDET